MPVCAVCSCASSVLTCDAHLFLADGAVALSLAAASTAHAHPQPQGSDGCAPSAPTSGLRTRGISSHCSSPVCQLVARPHCRVCVRHSRAGRMRALNAVSPHSHIVTSAQETHWSESTNIPDGVSLGRAVGLGVIAVGVRPTNHHNRISTRTQSGFRIGCIKCRYCQTYWEREKRRSRPTRGSSLRTPSLPTRQSCTSASLRPVQPAQDRATRQPGKHTLTLRDTVDSRRTRVS